MAASTFVGQAWVQISPSFTNFQSEVNQQMGQIIPMAGRKAGQQLGQNMGQEASKASSAAVQDSFATAGGKWTSAAVDAGKRFAVGTAKGIYNAAADVTRAAANVGGVAAAGMVAFGIKSAQSAMRVDELNVAMAAVAKSSHLSNKQIQDSAMGVKHMGIETASAQQVAIDFARANLNMADASKLARVAQDAAVIAQTNSTDATERLMQGIQTLQPELFRQLGIVIDASSAYDKYAKANHTTAKSLTGNQKQQALLNEVIAQGGKIAGTYEAAMMQPGKILRSFPRLFNDAQVAIGQGFTPALGQAIKPLYDFTKAVVKGLEPGGKLAPVVKAIGDAISGLLQPVTKVGPKLIEWFDKLSKADISAFAGAIKDMAPTLMALGAGLATFAGKNFLSQIPVLGQFLGGLNPIVTAIATLVLATPELRGALGGLIGPIKDLITPLMQVAQLLLGTLAKQVFRIISAAMPTIVKLFDSFVTVLYAVWKGIEPIVPILGDILVNAIKTLGPILAKIVEKFGEILVKIEPLLPKLLELAGTLIDLALKAIEPLIDPILLLVDNALGPLLQAIDPLIGPLNDMATALSPVVEVLAKFLGLIIKDLAPVIKPLTWLAIGILAVAAAFWVWDAALAAFDAVMAASGIGLLIMAIAAAVALLIVGIIELVKHWDEVWAAIQKAAKWAWEVVIKPVFDAIAAAALWLWQTVLQPVFNAVGAAWRAMANAFSWVYDNILAPLWTVISIALKVLFAIYVAPILIAIRLAWEAMSWAIQKAWANIIQPVWAAIQAAANWMWRNVLQPAFAGISTAFTALGNAFLWVWNVILKPVFNAVNAAVSWMWHNVCEPAFRGMATAWDAMSKAFKWVYDTIIKPLWDTFQGAINHTRDVLKSAVDVMAGAWDGLKKAIETPVRWVVNTIINPLIKGANPLLEKIGMKVEPIKLAEGGKVPGGWGGGDRIPALLEPGEWVLTKRQARGIGYNRLRNVPRYAEGGEVGKAKYGATQDPWGPFTMWPKWTNPVNWGKDLGNLAKKGFDLGKDVFNEATGLIRFAAAEAFELATKPLVELLKPAANAPVPPLMWTAVMGKWGLKIIDGTVQLIRGKSESQDAGFGGAGSALSEAIWGEAKKQLGKPYVWGARGPNGFDCSGLWDWSFGTSGNGPPPQGWKGPRVGPTTEQQKTLGKPISVGQAGIGDLLFFGNPIHHVAGALSPTTMIHAPHTGDVVRIGPIYEPPSLVKRLIDPDGTGTSGNIKIPQGEAVARWHDTVAQALKLWSLPPTEDWINGMLILIKNESGGNPTAVNNWDINAKNGVPSGGLTQTILPTFLANRHPSTSTSMLDPLANIAASIHYIMGRYGSIFNLPGYRSVIAGGRWIGYDSGGWLEPGISMVVNNTGRPEPVLTSDQWDVMNNPDNAQFMPDRGGPALAIQEAHFHDAVDIQLLMAQAEFAVNAGRL